MPVLSRRSFLRGGLAALALPAYLRRASALSSEDALPELTESLRRDGRFDGGGEVFGIRGILRLPPGAALFNLTLRQLAPGASQSVVTLLADKVDGITLVDVTVDRNGSGANDGRNTPPNGPINIAYGVMVAGGRHHRIENLNVTGNDAGTAVLFRRLDRSSLLRNIHVHDIFGIVPGAKDDVLQGISFQLCAGLVLEGLHCERLGWKNRAGDPVSYDNCRGIALSGCQGLVLAGPVCTDVGQAIDFSGDLGDGNRDCTVLGAKVRNCGTAGIKMANLTRRTRVVSSTAENCRLFGFVDGSSFETPVNDDDANVFVGCAAYDCGNPIGTTGGFIQLRGRRNYPNLPAFIDCMAIDRRKPPQMKWGFYNEVPPRDGASAKIINCEAQGYTESAARGF